ncbi:MAG: GIY-YIG nuclease family protein [Kangiellaceae bacterium]|nr:GIY-YIG nuclease family protein [Kangiellaceae bacterium]
MWFIYIIVSSDNKLYTGITTDVERRWEEHRSGKNGAKFFRGRKPKQLLYVTRANSRSEATKEEIKIKKLSRVQKLKMESAEHNIVSRFNFGNY